MLNILKKLRGQSDDSVSFSAGMAPAVSDKLQCQSINVNGVDLVFGATWTPASQDLGTQKILNNALSEGFANYASNEYESTVGLFGQLADAAKDAHAAAVVLAQHFAKGGVELFVFQQGNVCGLVGLMDYAPIPGFDAIGTQDKIEQLIREFSDLNSSQLVHLYGNVSWLSDLERIELNKVAFRADAKSKLKRIPNIKLRLLVGALVVMGVAACVYGYGEYSVKAGPDLASVQVEQRDPNVDYELTLAPALSQTGEPGNANVQAWHSFFAQVPLNVGGWRLKALECQQLMCNIVWTRASGTFSSFESKLPPALNAVITPEIDQDVVNAELRTQHDISKLMPTGPSKGLERNSLPVVQEVKKLWGSKLQDLSLLNGFNVRMGGASLFGGQGNAATLLRPVVKGTWSIDHEIWSLTDLQLPSYTVAENLKIAKSDSENFRYKIEGSYYAKAK